MRSHFLARLLRDTGRLVLLTETSRAVLWVLGGFLAIGLLALLTDAVLALGAWGLVAVDLAMFGLLIAGIIHIIRQANQHFFNPRRAARLLEEHADIRGSRLINAVEFSESERAPSSTDLVARVVDEGESVAEHLSPSAAIQSGPLFKAMGVAAAAMLVVLIGFLTAPRLFARVLPRYLDPLGEHPPHHQLRAVDHRRDHLSRENLPRSLGNDHRRTQRGRLAKQCRHCVQQYWGRATSADVRRRREQLHPPTGTSCR